MHDEVIRLCYKTCWCVQYRTSNGGTYTKSEPFCAVGLFSADLSKKNDLWKDSMYYAKFIRLILPLQTDFSHILETQILHFQV